MRKRFIVLVLSVALFGTSCKESCETDNMLLAKKVSSHCSVDFNNQENPEWTKSFNRLDFFTNLYDLAMSGKRKVYVAETELEDTTGKVIAKPEDIERVMKSHVDTFNLDLLKRMLFFEHWKFNRNTYRFTKDVIAWTPVKVWEDSIGMKQQVVLYIYPEGKNNEKGKLIAKNILYEIPWEQNPFPYVYTGFDQRAFINSIIEGVKDGSFKVYDPIYLVDKSKREFNAKELEEYIGVNFNSKEFYWSIHSLLFQEDWYFNKKTLQITKDIKSFAFVKADYNLETDKLDKKIMFFIIPE
jgi:hypothetical protein